MALPRNEARLIHLASSFPHGPSFISPEWRESSEDSPGLVSILVTRRAPGGVLVPGFALVDRTCLGVKNGFVGRPANPLELMDLVDEIAEAHGDMEQCDLLVAQSVLYHAIDFARSLAFPPHRDFPEPLFGPRPAALLDTPLSRPSRPIYVPGPLDDVGRIIRQLDRAVGDAFTFCMPNLGDLLESDDPWLDEEAEYEDDEEEDGEFGDQEDDTVQEGR